MTHLLTSLSNFARLFAVLLAAMVLAACKGSTGTSSGDNTTTPKAGTTYTVGGGVIGLGAGKSLVLQNNGGDDLTISADGNFTFKTGLAPSTTYQVTVKTHPAEQLCIASNTSGTVTTNVTNVSITCAAVTIPASPTLSISYSTKRLILNWNGASNATHYQLFENADGASGYSQVGGDLSTTTYTQTIFLPDRVNASYFVKACNSAGCTSSATAFVSTGLAGAVGYLKASNNGANDVFGYSVSLSADGSTLAIGAYGEASSATGIDGTQSKNDASLAGAVYVFSHSGNTWSQQAYIKASNAEAGDMFGVAVALSSDGNTLAVGASGEDSNATGIGGVQSDNSAANSGAAYLFTRSGSTWSQQAYVKASNTQAYDWFGHALALSSDGSTLAVGAFGEDSGATGIDGAQGDNSATNSGAVYLFTGNGSTWSQQAYIKASNAGANDWFGSALSLSSDGNTLAIGAYGEDSNGNQGDNSVIDSGAVYLLNRSGGVWSQQAYLKASNAEAGDMFGIAVALSGDGNTLAVGASGEDSNAIGVGGAQGDNSASNSGAVYLFTRSGSNWPQQAYVKASNTESNDGFGSALALSNDGNTLAVGAFGEDSNATGIGGTQSDNSATESGAVYLFIRSGSTWSQRAYTKASNSEAYDWFGSAISLNSAGDILVVGAPGEDSASGGGDQKNNDAVNSGAVYLY